MVAPYYDDGRATLYVGHVLAVLAGLEAGSVQTCITSPPYWGLRAYGTDPQVWGDWRGELGSEPTPAQYVANIVAVFRAVRRVLRDDGTLWVNLGDSYAGSGKGPSNSLQSEASQIGGRRNPAQFASGQAPTAWMPVPQGLKAKDLVGIPWRVAFALQADGWYLRSDIIWSKPNPMPESVTDRPTRAHEYLFLLSKQPVYYFDSDAIREPHQDAAVVNGRYTGGGVSAQGYEPHTQGFNGGGIVMRDREYNPAGRNRRSVWTIPTEAYPAAHFATFPRKLVEPCVLAGSRPEDVVLDPFAGSGTTLAVARWHQRRAIGVELSADYARLIEQRLAQGVLL